MFYKRDSVNLVLRYHNNVSRYKYWPGLSDELLRYQLSVAGRPLTASASAAAWLQPRGQRFAASRAEPGGFLALSAAFPLTRSRTEAERRAPPPQG